LYALRYFPLSPPLSFFSMLPRPPRSPLFPYTTLFRSQRPFDFRHRPRSHRSQLLERCDQIPVVVEVTDDRRTDLAHHRIVGLHQDRKSTRLNSSHSQISYAVFCLKKKKKIKKKKKQTH